MKGSMRLGRVAGVPVALPVAPRRSMKGATAQTEIARWHPSGSGKVTGRCFPRRRTKEFIAFMENIARRYEGRELHVVLDNLSTHHNKTVELWLAKNQNVTLHFTPTGSSWMNQVETWFGIITQQAIRRGTFGSVKILIQTIERYITNWNTDCEPFTWTATEGEILAKVKFIESEVRRMLDCNAK